MSSVIEMVANKKKPAPTQEVVVLPILHEEHDAECGDACGCGEGEGGCSG